MPIQVLSEVVAAQIAAGEVVERPASVIKELLENSLDAGAHSIRIEAETGGRRLIRITDDGSGIPAAEVELAFARHATSKLQTIDDLDSLQTLGFRGEALASIASVAQVTLLTRTAHDKAGTIIRMEGGRVVDRRAAGTPAGTTISVENLFFNTPARLKFMKAETTERRHIDNVVTRYGMAYPNVRFTLVQDSRPTFSTTGSGALADVLIEVLGIDTMRDMLEVTPVAPQQTDLPDITVYGYVGAPKLNRNTRSHIVLFVNGRHIQDVGLSYAVGQAYHTLMASDRYPVAVLMINLPSDQVDVNVHPTKAEVRFRSQEDVFAAVQRAVRRTVIAQAPIPTIMPPPREDRRSWERSTVAARHEPSDQLDLDLPVYDPGRRSQQIAPEETTYEPETTYNQPVPTVGAASAESMQRPRTLPPLRVLGQIGATYIVAEGPAGLYLVDQHAAHERILYEQFMRQQQSRQPIVQQTLDAATLELGPAAAQLIEDQLDTLNAIGFDIEPFGNNGSRKTFRIRAVPAMLANRIPEEAIATILEDLEIGAEPGAADIEAQIILRVCKAAAIKAGQTLSYDEMQSLLRQLERCASPRTCPHGRPTLIHMSADQLAKEFGRT